MSPGLRSVDGKSCGRTLYDTALAGGAQALGRLAGSLAPGNWADMIAIDVENPALLGLNGDRLLDGWIFAGDRHAVGDVWSAGRHVVHEGRHRDRDAIFAAYKARVASILAKISSALARIMTIGNLLQLHYLRWRE